MHSHVAVLVVSAPIGEQEISVAHPQRSAGKRFCCGYTCAAREVLSQRHISVVFCEQRASDGPYVDLLAHALARPESVQFVIVLCTGEQAEYAEAVRFGAAEAVRCPLQPTDVELALIHAKRKHANAYAQRAYAAPVIAPEPISS